MPLFIDIHEHLEGLTDDAVAKAHQVDLETQTRYGAKYPAGPVRHRKRSRVLSDRSPGQGRGGGRA